MQIPRRCQGYIFVSLLGISFSQTVSSSAAADDCTASPAPKAKEVDGDFQYRNGKLVAYSYSHEITEYDFSYKYCIRHKSDEDAFVIWYRDDAKTKKIFNQMVYRGTDVERNVRSTNRDDRNDRPISAGPSQGFQTDGSEVQTIYSTSLTSTDLIHLVASNSVDRRGQSLVSPLSTEENLRSYLEKNGSLIIGSSTRFDVPSTNDLASDQSEGKIKSISKDLLIGFDLQMWTAFEIKDDQPTYSIVTMYRFASDEDAMRYQNGLHITITPTENILASLKSADISLSTTGDAKLDFKSGTQWTSIINANRSLSGRKFEEGLGELLLKDEMGRSYGSLPVPFLELK